MDIAEIDEQDAKRVLAEPFWSLTDALVWVATRSPSTICYVRRAGSDNVEETRVVISEAWELLSAAMCEQLNAFATKTQKRWNGGSEHSSPGMLFPPVAQPGVARAYRPELDRGQLVLVPKEKPFANEWSEWSEVSFSSADVIGKFPPNKPPAQLDEPSAGINAIVEALRATQEASKPTALQFVTTAASPRLTKGEIAISEAFAAIFPDGKVPSRASDRNKKIRSHFSDRGETAPDARSIQRFLAKTRKTKTPQGDK